jgi:hypothetical protein
MAYNEGLGLEKVQEERRRAFRPAKPDNHPSLIDKYTTSSLQEGDDTTSDSEAEHGSIDGNAGSRVATVLGAAAASGGTAGRGVGARVRVGLVIVALAAVDTLDLVATTLLGGGELLELVASVADVRSADHIEGTLDIVQDREFDAASHQGLVTVQTFGSFDQEFLAHHGTELTR